ERRRGPERRHRRGADAEIGRTADRVGGHGKETRQRPHSNTWPAAATRPRAQSCAGIRALPAGLTSSIRTAPRPVATVRAGLTVRISPGDPAPGTARAPNSLISIPPSVLHAPGWGSKARISRPTLSA